MSKLIVELPEHLHTSLKRQAVASRTTLKAIVISLLNQYLEGPRATSSRHATGLCGAWKDRRPADELAQNLRASRRWWIRSRG